MSGEKRKYIQIATPFVDEQEWRATQESLLSGWMTQGPKVAKFEQQFASLHGVKHALATTSCTTALHLALVALGVGPEDKVIVPSFTWIATANVVEYCGATPVFCDSDLDTYNITPSTLRQAIAKCAESGTPAKAVIVVHLFGLCAEMDAIMAIADEHGLAVVEDAACAVGATYQGKHAGSFGKVGCFSFHPRKIVTTGEGGMCTTDDSELADKINCLRNHGASLSEEQRHHSNKPYLMPDFNVMGFNYRMTDMQGAIGTVQLSRLEKLIEERRTWAAYYSKELADIEWLVTPKFGGDAGHSWQAYVCRVNPDKAPLSRNDIADYLHQRGIGTRAGTHTIHQLGYYAGKYNIGASDYPVASHLYANTLAIPLHNNMSPEDYQYVVDTLKGI